jgi:cellulose synthase/poly-beta-1,6-N-acetylglucosamine synthase-like glycosyltransferase
MNRILKKHDEVASIPTTAQYVRPSVKGKFICLGNERFYIRGVTYGTFRPDAEGNLYPDPETVNYDFSRIAENGINAVRTYTAPPSWLLDIAHRHGLRVMVGLWWEQFITFLDDKKIVRNVENKIREAVRTYAGHPALLCYAIGNEIPSAIVRWHGHRRIEKFIEKLYWIAKEEDPQGLVTYVNYPTTEYLQLPFLDLAYFNVYLESRDTLAAYLYRLQNISGEKPLIMGEIGIDSNRNGNLTQAIVLDWQIRSAFMAGCAGSFVFSWTDEWHCGGCDIEDWDFGITTRDRKSKPALTSVRKAYSEVPFKGRFDWPSLSVIVCTFNGSKTIGDALEALSKLDYPNYEVLIINDGSNDKTECIAKEYASKFGFKLITTENRGLSNARNTGLRSAAGEIVAYLDDDALPDAQWLRYLALSFLNTNHVGFGGPNIAPEGDGLIADCVANAPGNPSHVLISDQEAEHIPGCNMAFRRDALLDIGGFDHQFKIAGDDVDLCWRLKKKGWTLGFSPAAVVWHHRRKSIRSFWKQQLNYGRAEALLERKWPEKYNGSGNCTWTGRLYGNGYTRTLGLAKTRIYQGTWGSAPFQSIYQSNPGTIQSILLIPESYLAIFALFVLSCIAFLWRPMLITLPILVFAVGFAVVQSVMISSRVRFPNRPRLRYDTLKMHLITAMLQVMQPLARLFGRVSYGLTPWRRHGKGKLSFPWVKTQSFWRDNWQVPDKWIESVERELLKQGAVVMRGGEYDKWDLEIRGGLFGTLRLLVAVEEHGAGKQMIRVRSWPRISTFGIGLTIIFALLAGLAAFDQSWYAYLVLGALSALTMIRSFGDCATAAGSYLKAIKQAFEQSTS